MILAALLLMGINAAAASTSLEPCSVFTQEEASIALKGPVKAEVPSPIRYRGIQTGGTCVYRLVKDPNVTITVRSDATPTGAQRQRFDAGLRRAAELSGLGDRAYVEVRPEGPQSVTFLRGDTLATVTVEGLGIDVAKKVAAVVAPRLPTSIDVPATSPSGPAVVGKLDPALVGSWFLTEPSGRSLANLQVERDGRFYMTLLAGNRQQSGRIDAENGVLHLYPERGGSPQEVRYRMSGKDQMEWTDARGNVTVVRRQFR